jgi:hypothetical protein
LSWIQHIQGLFQIQSDLVLADERFENAHSGTGWQRVPGFELIQQDGKGKCAFEIQPAEKCFCFLKEMMIRKDCIW